jgi:hypothetical protein
VKPGFEHLSGCRDERCSPLLSSLADGVHVGAGGERDVLAVEGDQFGDPQSGLDRQREHGVVATAGPGGLVAGFKQRIDLGVGEVGEQVALGSFRWDREHPLDRGGVLGVVQGEVGEQRVDRRESVVAGRGRVVALVFEVLEERGDQRRVEVGDVELAGWGAASLGGEAQEQPEGVAVGGDRVRARRALADEAVGEERLCGRPHRRSYPNPQTM